MANILNNSGYTVGRIESNGDVRNSSGYTIGRVESNGDVRDDSGHTVGRIESNGDVRSSSGYTVGRVESNGDVRDDSGYTVGRAESVAGGAAFLLLEQLSNSQSDHRSSSRPIEIKEPEGCLGMLGAYFVLLLKSNWGGRIGIIIGVVMAIVMFFHEKNNSLSFDYNALFSSIVFGIIISLVLGTAGAFIAMIINYIRNMSATGKKILLFLFSLVLLAVIIMAAMLAYTVHTKNAEKKMEKAVEKVEEAEEATKSPGFKTVKMPDGKVWMAENLNIETGKSACYDNKPENCQKYGRLYDWKTAMKACPSGWHLPGSNEWETLANNIGSNVGKKLKSKDSWNGTDEYGFSALPGGLNASGKFSGTGSIGLWWSATEHDAGNALRYIIDGSHDNMDKLHNDKARSLSVRCIQD